MPGTVPGMSALLPFPMIAAALAMLGLVAGPFLARLAARRAFAQPLEMALADEVNVLVGVLSDLRRLPYMTSLVGADFAAHANGRIWDALCQVCSNELSQLSQDPDDAECARIGEQLSRRADDVHADLTAALGAGTHAGADLARLAYLSGTSALTQPTDVEVVEAGEAVLLTANSRVRLAGSGLVVPGPDPDSVDPDNPPVRRLLSAVTRVRQLLAAVAVALAAALVPGLVTSAGLKGAGAVVAAAGLVAMVAGTAVIALVDHDTMYVDLRTMIATATTSWLAAVAAAGLGGHWTRLLQGVVVVAVTAVTFEVLNLVHRKLRGMDGQGLGDTLIIIVTAGLPAAVTGHWVLGLWSVTAAALCGVVGWVVSAARGRATRSTPFAFGPYLAVGWVVGWVAYVAATPVLATRWPGLL